MRDKLNAIKKNEVTEKNLSKSLFVVHALTKYIRKNSFASYVMIIIIVYCKKYKIEFALQEVFASGQMNCWYNHIKSHFTECICTIFMILTKI